VDVCSLKCKGRQFNSIKMQKCITNRIKTGYNVFDRDNNIKLPESYMKVTVISGGLFARWKPLRYTN
jgi:hypothetical protein